MTLSPDIYIFSVYYSPLFEIYAEYINTKLPPASVKINNSLVLQHPQYWLVSICECVASQKERKRVSAQERHIVIFVFWLSNVISPCTCCTVNVALGLYT